MPSSKRYKANRKDHYAQERRTKIKREGTKADPKATRTTVERARLRKKLGLKKGNPAQAGHTGRGKLANKLKGRKSTAPGRKQSAKLNQRAGGKIGNTAGKARGAAIGRRSKKA
jgi:hypothetical protein